MSVATGGGCWPRAAGGASAGMPRRLPSAELLPLPRLGMLGIPPSAELLLGTLRMLLPSARLLLLQRLPGRRAGRKHRLYQERT